MTNEVGIDVGVKHFATTTSGKNNQPQRVENPKFLKKHLPHLKYLARQLSKKGQNRLKARIKLSKYHAKIKNLRKDFVQKLSSGMIKTHDIFCIESLDISNLME